MELTINNRNVVYKLMADIRQALPSVSLKQARLAHGVMEKVEVTNETIAEYQALGSDAPLPKRELDVELSAEERALVASVLTRLVETDRVGPEMVPVYDKFVSAPATAKQ